MMNVKNRRHYKRYSIKGRGYITNGNSQKVVFQVNDISASGMNITADKELNGTDSLLIHFDDTGMMMLPSAKQLKGTVVQKKQIHNMFNYSIRFDLTHMQIVELDEYLRFLQHDTVIGLAPEESDRITHSY